MVSEEKRLEAIIGEADISTNNYKNLPYLVKGLEINSRCSKMKYNCKNIKKD